MIPTAGGKVVWFTVSRDAYGGEDRSLSGAANTAPGGLLVALQASAAGARRTKPAAARSRTGWTSAPDRFCDEGELLTLWSPPSGRRSRHWCAEQVADQVAGLPGRSWPPEM